MPNTTTKLPKIKPPGRWGRGPACVSPQGRKRRSLSTVP